VTAGLVPLGFDADGAVDTSGFALDVHAHLVPIAPASLAAIAGVIWDAAREALSIDGHALGLRDLFHPERLIAWMDQHRVARAFISVPPPVYRQQLDLEAARRWADYLNDGLQAIAAYYPDRLQALLHLPLEHPGLAAQLAGGAPAGIAGFAVAAGGSSAIDFAGPACEPLWCELGARESFVFVHPGQCCDGRLDDFYLHNLLGNPYETTVAASRLIMAGVPTRHPGIRFCLAHAGGFLASVAGRLARGVETRRPGVPVDDELVSAVLRRLRVDCIAHDPQMLALARASFGDDHVMFGSDWPFPMGLPDPSSLR
jgi:aminocarboxymuconate-semialdehyde decarboxylase